MQIERVLRVRDPVQVAVQEQRFAPVQRMAAGLDGGRHGADIESTENESVQDLARWAPVEALRVVTVLMVDVARDVAKRQVWIAVARAVIGGVVPTGRAEAQAVPLAEHNVELRQQVEASCDKVAAIEAVRPFVGYRRIADLVVPALDAHPEVEAHGVIPADC